MNRTIFTALCMMFLCGCGSSTKATNPADSSTADSSTADSSTADSSTGAASTTSPEKEKPAAQAAKSRKFLFNYQFRVKNLSPAASKSNDASKNEDARKNLVRVWIPCASNSEFQEVKRLEATAPAKTSENLEPRFGNQLLYFETAIPESGEFTVNVPYEIVRHEVLRAKELDADQPPKKLSAQKLTAEKRSQFLAADTLVPTTGKPLRLLESVELSKDPRQLARQLYDIVDKHVSYNKEGTGWGRGDSNWVCDSQHGNCTDFHSLFMSLARSQGIPTRFEIGFSIPTDKPAPMDKPAAPIAGYHCWAWFYLDDIGWLPVDISEADKHPEMKEYYFGNLTADRVTFSVGRDLELVPAAKYQPLNFMIYPHVEVGGELLSKEQLELQFTYKDLP